MKSHRTLACFMDSNILTESLSCTILVKWLLDVSAIVVDLCVQMLLICVFPGLTKSLAFNDVWLL